MSKVLIIVSFLSLTAITLISSIVLQKSRQTQKSRAEDNSEYNIDNSEYNIGIDGIDYGSNVSRLTWINNLSLAERYLKVTIDSSEKSKAKCEYTLYWYPKESMSISYIANADNPFGRRWHNVCGGDGRPSCNTFGNKDSNLQGNPRYFEFRTTAGRRTDFILSYYSGDGQERKKTYKTYRVYCGDWIQVTAVKNRDIICSSNRISFTPKVRGRLSSSFVDKYLTLSYQLGEVNNDRIYWERRWRIIQNSFDDSKNPSLIDINLINLLNRGEFYYGPSLALPLMINKDKAIRFKVVVSGRNLEETLSDITDNPSVISKLCQIKQVDNGGQIISPIPTPIPTWVLPSYFPSPTSIPPVITPPQPPLNFFQKIKEGVFRGLYNFRK